MHHFRDAWGQLRAGMSDVVTPRWLHDRRLRAEREADRIFDTSPALLAVAGFDGYLRRFNPAFEVFGYSREELLSRPWIEFAHPDDRERMLEAAASLDRGTDVAEIENRVVCRDGSLRWVQWSTRVVPEDRLFYAAGRDVTESRRATAEQAALRRVATLIARETPPDDVFAAVAREVGEILGVDAAHLGRYEPDGTVVSVAQWGRYRGVPIGARYPLEGDSASARVFRTGRPARMDTYVNAAGVIAQTVQDIGIRSSVGVPISVEGRIWGVMIATSKSDIPFAPETESRLQGFTELLATAISNATAHAEVRALVQEQAALRRVATLVAKQAPQAELFALIAEEIGQLLAVDTMQMVRYEDRHATALAAWGTASPALAVGERVPLGGRNVTSLVFRTGRAARLDDYGDSSGAIGERVVKAGDVRSAVASPIFVEGRLWGAMIAAGRRDDPLPPQTESRLGQFTELMATAIANAAGRTELARLADEQAALRRVATLVAEGVSASELFGAVTEEVGRLIDADLAGMIRYVDEDTITPVGVWAADGEHPAVEGLWPLEGDVIATAILSTRRPAREDDWGQVGGPIADFVVNVLGVHSSVGSPIVVQGRVWGALFVHSKRSDRPLAPGTESRLASFAELVATATSNAQARAELERLAEEQATLRRVATLVARESSPTEVFVAIADEVAKNIGSGAVGMLRFEPDRTATLVAQSDTPWDPPPLGTRFTLEGEDVVAAVLRTKKPVRLDDWANATGAVAEMARVLGIRSSVATPIVVEGQLWGTMIAVTDQSEPLPADTESRLGQVTELVATAIANAEARSQVLQLVKEQAALRRVATLVAEGAQPGVVFDAVTREVAQLLDVSAATLSRFDDDGLLTVVAISGNAPYVRVGQRFRLGGTNPSSIVRRTGRSARLDDFAPATGPVGESARGAGVGSVVATPVVVEGRTWGSLTAIWSDRGRPPDDTEQRMARFGELLDTAIANADSREQLTASRARVLAAGDEARRRVVRDLHDGAQQRLVHTIVILKLAQRALTQDPANAKALVAEGLENAERANAELRELAHGILPSILSRGLGAGITALVSRLDLAVEVDVSTPRLPPDIEASAYFVVAEALTNVAKHSRAKRAQVTASVEDGALRLRVRDDGVGGARPEGNGLVGLADRIAALGGRFHVESPAGSGTLVAADIPVSDEPGRSTPPPTSRADSRPEPGGSPAPVENSSGGAHA